ncbi:MAG: DUF3048 domain-containing protein [Candidatus Woesebacteria bacterium]|nr:MAG: DUF3048 domain-containing protein [Candidatus Woesebacteria bacterium]
MYKDRIKKFLTPANLKLGGVFFGLFAVATLASWAIFTFLNKSPQISEIKSTGDISKDRAAIKPDQPKSEACPLNGAMYTVAEKAIWGNRRPITAMIENHAESRPPEGLSKADVLYEAVAEGGITRFLAVFYCGAAASDVKIAPVRSVRIYFLNWAAEYADFPIFMHVGGANDYSGSGDTAPQVRALEKLESLGWRVPKGNDFDTTYDSGYPIFWRDYERLGHEIATEHTMTASSDEAYKEAEKRGFGAQKDGKPWDANFVSWKFTDDAPTSSPQASKISFKFWDDMSDYNVDWQYDSKNNNYLRSDGGKPHTDMDYQNIQLSAKNVVVMKVKEIGPIDRNYHMFYQNIGSGDALVFQNGNVIKATWQKQSITDRTKFFDEAGKEISFVRGTIWIEAIPLGNQVAYN